MKDFFLASHMVAAEIQGEPFHAAQNMTLVQKVLGNNCGQICFLLIVAFSFSGGSLALAGRVVLLLLTECCRVMKQTKVK